VTQSRVEYESTIPRGTDEGIDLWEAYGYETWCHTLKKEHWWRVFENRVQRKIFASKMDKVTEDWKRMHNE